MDYILMLIIAVIAAPFLVGLASVLAYIISNLFGGKNDG